jgi:hypothetical protein
MPENPIYDFLKANGLTDKDEATFLKEYSDSTKAKELHGFFSANKLTDKDFNSFYGEYLKKKDGGTPSPVSSGTTPLVSEAPSTSNENQEVDLFALQNEKQQLNQRVQDAKTNKAIGSGGIGGSMIPMASTPQPTTISEESRIQAIDKEISAAGYNPKEVHKVLDGIPPTARGVDVKQLVQESKDNPLSFSRHKAAFRWQSPLFRKIEAVEGDAAEAIKSDILQQSEYPTYEAARLQMRKVLENINKYVDNDVEKDVMIKQAIEDKKFAYGMVGMDTLMKDERYAGSDLNIYQINALNFLEDTNPDAFKAYTRLLSVTPDSQSGVRGYEYKLRELENIGLGLQDRASQEVLTDLANKFKKEGALSTEEQAQYQNLYERYEQVKREATTQKDRYPQATMLDADSFAQEALEKERNGWLKQGVLGVGEEVNDVKNWLGSVITAPFTSEKNEILSDWELLGEKKLSQQRTQYVTDKNSLFSKPVEVAYDKELNDEIEKIKADETLSDSDKLDKVQQAIFQNFDQVGFVPKDSKFNFSANAWAHGISDIGQQLFAQIGIGYLTGGVGNVSKVKQLSNLFGTVYATAYNDYYTEALEKNIANPSVYATTHTAIEAASELLHNDYAMVKKMVNPKSTLGKLMETVTKEQWEAMAKAGSSRFKKIGKALVETGKQSATMSRKETIEEVAGQLAGNAVNIEGYNEDIPIEHGLKETAVITFLGMLPLGIVGVGGQYNKINRSQQYALYEAAQNPEKYLQKLDEAVEDGTVKEKDAEKIRQNIAVAVDVLKRNNPEGKTDNERAADFTNKVVSVIMPYENKRPEIVTAPPKTKSKVAVVTPEENARPLPITIGGNKSQRTDAVTVETKSPKVILPQTNQAPNVVETIKQDTNETIQEKGNEDKALLEKETQVQGTEEGVAEESVPEQKGVDDSDYRLQHRPNGDPESSSSLDDLTKGGEFVPSDFYTHPEYYGDIKQKTYQESWKAIKSAKGNPEAEVTIYRSVPKGVKTINKGDWVSLSPTYAKEEGLHPSDSKKDMPVISMKVKAKDIRWDGNDMNEFGYFPQEEVKELKPKKKKSLSANQKKAETIDDLTDPHDIVLRHFAKGGKINPSVIQKLFGNKRGKNIEGERRARISLMSKEGLTIEQIAHQLWEENPQHETDVYKDAIERVIGGYTSQESMAKDLVDRYINQTVKQDLTEEEAAVIDDALIAKVHKEVEGLTEDVKNELTLLLSDYQDKYGFIDWDKLEEDFNGFTPQILNLSEKSQTALDEIINKNSRQETDQRNDNVGKDDSQKETSSKEERLKAAQSNYEKATRKLKEAEDKVAKKQSTQTGMFGDAAQKELFGVQRDEAKEILDPLRAEVKKAKTELEAAQKEADKVEGQPQLFESPEKQLADKTGLVLFHGSPHKFEDFDISKLGSGEGAQAFGSGLYFTNKEEIARGYANRLSSRKNFWEALQNGYTISLSKEDFDFIDKEIDALGFDGGVAENDNLGEIIVDGKEDYAPQVLDAMAILFGNNAQKVLSEDYGLSESEVQRLIDIKGKIANPQLYKVVVHEGKPPSQYDYIDWQDKLTDAQKKKLSDEDIPEDATGKDVYKSLSKKLGSDQKASEYLLSKGIDGVTYKTEKGTGGKDGSGRNYVVFDSKSIRVDEINNQPSKSKLQQLADKIRKDGILPEFLKANLPEGTQKQGFGGKSLIEAMARAIELVDAALQAGKEMAQAIEEGFAHIRDYYKQNTTKFDEDKLRAGFNAYARNKFDTGGIRHEDTEAIRGEFGFPEYERQSETFEQWEKEATDRVENGELPKLIEKLKKGQLPSEVEQRMLDIYITSLKQEARKNPSNENLKQLLEAVQLSDQIAGSEVGKSLAARKGASNAIADIGDYYVAKMEANAVDELTEDQKKEVQEKFAEYEKKLAEETKKREEAEAYVTKLKAQKAFTETKHRAQQAKKKSKEDYAKERKDILQNIKDKWNKAGNSGNLTAVPVPYAAQLYAIAPDVAKLTRSFVEEGVDKLGDLVDRVHDVIKEAIPDITHDDVQALIAGDYNKKPTRTELAEKLYNLRQEAKLLNQLADLESGIVPKDEKRRVKHNAKLKELRDKIKEQRRQLLGIEEDSETPLEKRYRQAIKKNKEEAQKILDKINRGDFSKEKKVGLLDDLEFKRNNPRLYNELVNAAFEREEAKHKMELALFLDERKRRSKLKKAGDLTADIIGTTKAVVTTFDLSATFIQDVVPMLAHPKVGFKALGTSLSHLASERRFSRWLTVLHNSQYFDLIKKSGLDVTEPSSLTAQEKEETFDRNLLNKTFTIKGKSFNIGKYYTKPFERAFTSLGNVIRVTLFMKMAEKYYNEGVTFDNNPKLFKDLAKHLNTSTGRGTLPEWMQRNAKVASTVIWSPRLMASRLNLLGLGDIANPILAQKKGFYASLDPEIRKMAIYDMVSFISTVVLIYGGAVLLFGGDDDDVEADLSPTSVTFGDLKVGNKSYNLFGGFSQYVKLVFQMYFGSRKMDEEVEDISDAKGKSRLDLGGRFIRGKVTPAVGVLADYADAKDYSGQPVTHGEQAKKLLTPLSLRETYKNINRDGVIPALGNTVIAMTGVNVKDDRDFYDNPLSGEAGKFLTNNKIKVPRITRENITVKKDEAHPDGMMTETEFEKYKKRRIELMEDDVKDLMAKGWYVTRSKKVTVDELVKDRDELEKVIKMISTHAATEAKDEMFKKTRAELRDERKRESITDKNRKKIFGW